jgi:subtilase family serine protease
MKALHLSSLFTAGVFSCAAAAAPAAPIDTRASSTIAASELNGARDLGRAAGSGVDFSVVLPYRRAAELSYLLAAQSNPATRYYRRFLAARDFRGYFSPTEARYDAAARQLERAGFSVETFANRTVLHAHGTASTAERYFHTLIDIVRPTNGRLAYANVASATIPPGLAGARVVGLNSIVTAHVAPVLRTPSVHPAGTGGGPLFGPDGGFGPAAITKAENFPSEHGYRGRNSNVADLIDGVVNDSDVATFLRAFGLQRSGPRTTAVSVDGGCNVIPCNEGFSAMFDAEWILAVAPAASLFTYTIPALSNAAIVDGFNAIASDDAVNIVNVSFGSCELSDGDLDLAIEPIVAQGAAEGITFESIAVGGANLCSEEQNVALDLPMAPANLDTLTAVGASSTFVDSTGQQLAESGYNNTNGGVSLIMPLPTWQASTPGVTRTGRNVPDVVMPGSIDGVGPSLYYSGNWYGGFATVNNAPFAGYLATVQEMYGYATPLGNIAPALYAIFNRFGYREGGTTYFTDVQVGCIGAVANVPICAKAGYDLASGIGSIGNGYALAKSFGFGPIAPPTP